MMTEEEILDVIADVRYKDWRFIVPAARPLVLTIQWIAEDTFNPGELSMQHSRPWLLQPKNANELLRTIWLAIVTAKEHEARELFTYRGKHIFGPHKNHLPKEAAVV